MTLESITILNYKNIAEATLKFSPKINCFVGSNGEGKTNLLDAIYYLSFTHSLAGASDSLNIRHGADMMMISGKYDTDGTEDVYSCAVKTGQKKIFRHGQKAYKRMSEHIGKLPLILVSPYDNDLITGGSEERRRYMDIVVSQYNTTYMHSLIRYNKALSQRNAMLKQMSEGGGNADMLDIYEEMMAVEGEYIHGERQKFINQLIPVFQQYYSRISTADEKVSLTYTSHCERGPLLDTIRRDRSKDIAVGYSLHGIHRDDLVMQLGGYPIRKEGSQGQNKTYLISMKLAQFDFLCNTGSHTKPLLLLDDIFDKLDASRVEQIVALVSGDKFGQIFITDTNRENIGQILEASQGGYQLFNVKAGTVE